MAAKRGTPIPSVRLRIEGVTPLLMNADTGVDPLHPKTKALALYSKKKTKTEDDHREMGRAEFLLGLWLTRIDGVERVCIPAHAMMRTLNEAAAMTKEGPKIRRGVIVEGDAVLEYPGPSDPDELVDAPGFMDRRSVCIQQRRVMRVRPKFPQWAATFDILLDPGQCDVETLQRIASTAGRYIALGNYRIAKGGTFGRFAAEVIQ